MLKRCAFFPCLFLCVFVLFTSPTLAQKGSLSLSPASVESLNVGDELEFSLNITGSEGVSAYQATIEFDASALRHTSSENGDYLAAGAFFVLPKVQGNRLKLAAASGSERQGSGTLATVTFEVVAVKASTLTLSDTLFSNTQGQTAPPQQVTGAEITEPPGVSIPDAALAGAIRRALNLNEGDILTAEVMATPTRLNASDMEISDLTGIEHATNLQTLILSDNQITDITLLTTLTNLQTLNLEGNQLTDLTPLPVLINLQTLILSDNQITDITLLTTLTNLQTLNLEGNQLTDLTPLSVLINLQSLTLSDNQIDDVTPLATLTNLQSLALIGNQISNVAPLVALGNLQLLLLSGNPLGDTTPLASLTEVTSDVTIEKPMEVPVPDTALAEAIRSELGLEAEAPITQEDMQTLTHLNASDMEISNLTGIEHATNLQTLELENNQISDITPLIVLVNLQFLLLSGNQISDIAPLVVLVNLQTLHLEGNPLGDTSPLATLTNLTNVDVEIEAPAVSIGTDVDVEITEPVVSVPDTALAGAIRSELSLEAEEPITQKAMQTLTHLNASDMEISNLTGIEHATNLQTLELENNQISDITPLIVLVNLQFLLLSGNQISDVAPLVVLVNLQTLHLEGNPLEDTSPLAELTNLTEVDVEITEPPVSVGTEVDVEITEPVVSVPDTALAGAIRSELGLETEAPITQEAIQTLTHLNASDQGISDLTGLEQATNLQVIELQNNQISDVTPLATLTNLQTLTLSGNQISDVTPLVVLVNLETLHLEGNPLGDTSPLATLMQLTTVDVEITEPRLPADVNNDGRVNILDLVLISTNFGKTEPDPPEADINGDGIVDIADLVLSASAFGTGGGAAPLLNASGLDTLTTAEVKGWLSQAQHLDITDATSRNGILFLEQLLAALTPEKTVLLPNYPNPFNPETWIPYHLATPTEVQITIYDATGKVVRRLDLRYQPTGYYTDRSRAAYWDGKNALGEPVASGIYFYQLETAQVSLLRKMVILK